MRLALVAGLLGCALAAFAHPDQLLEARIAQAIAALGDPRFPVREAASNTLWHIGAAAKPALLAALASPDSEVVSRSRQVLRLLDMGVSPDTPRDLRAAIERLGDAAAHVPPANEEPAGESNDASASARRALADAEAALLAMGSRGFAPLVDRVLRATDGEALSRALEPFRNSPRDPVRYLIATGRFADAGTLLDRVSTTPWRRFELRDLAAFHLMRNSAAAATAELIARRVDGSDARRGWLAWANGDLDGALTAARASDPADLLARVLVEREDWVGLYDRLARAAPHFYDDGDARLGQLALLARLADDAPARARAVDALAGRVRADGFLQAYKAFNVLALLAACGRFDDALADSLRHDVRETRTWRAELFHVLARRAELRAEVAMAVKEDVDGDDGRQCAHYPIGVVARLERLAGNTSHGRAIFAAQLARLEPDIHYRFIDEMCPDRQLETWGWWDALARERPTDSLESRLEQLDRILDGRADPAVLLAWARAEIRRVAFHAEWLAPTLRRYGHAAAMLDLLEAHVPADDPQRHWATAANLAFDAQLWHRAERAYARALDYAPGEPALLGRRAVALERLGRTAEATALIETALLCALGDERAHASLAAVLPWLDHGERFTQPLAAVVRRCTGDYLQAASTLTDLAALLPSGSHGASACGDLVHVALASMSQGSGMDIVERLRLMARLELAFGRRARALGRTDAAIAHAEAALDAFPRDVEAHLLRASARRDRARAEADLEVERAWLAGVAAKYPDSARVHHELAWYAARCRRWLPVALASATRAVALAPDVARHRDTLAEVHFQTNDRAAAISAAEDALALDPGRAYYHRQLRRFRNDSPTSDPR